MHPHRFRFFVSAADVASVSIEGAEHHHLTKVLRLPVKTEVEVFDGKGWVAWGRVERLSSQSTIVQIEGVLPQRTQQPTITICLGALKSNSCDELLPPLVELGVDVFHLFISEGNARHRGSETAQARWQRILLTAVKQCKRSTIPTIAVWPSCEALLQEATFPADAQRWMLDPESETLLGAGIKAQTPSVIGVGSEKGLSSMEGTLFREAGFAPVSLGNSILRATTAAIAAVAVLSHYTDKNGVPPL
jgi:16S rRNA (uracil1498-N3)-methyltransferase